MSINKIVVSGNLGADPEVRMTQSGTSILTFRLAIGDWKPDGNGGGKEYTHWIDVVLFDKNGKRVDYFSKHLHKSKKVMVEGKISYSQWETNDGQKRSKHEIVANDIDFERPPRDQQNGNSGTYSQGYQNARQTTPQSPSGGIVQQRVQELANPPQADVFDEDIPF